MHSVWSKERSAQRALSGTAILLATAGLTSIGVPGRAFAEFEIPEVDAEKGAVEAEYRGASHWGLPPADEEDDLDLLRQSHEVEFQYGVTDWWMLRITPDVEQPDGESVQLSSIGLETQFVLAPRRGGLFGLAVMAGYGPYSLFADGNQADELEFGPVVEIAPGPWLFTLNPRLTDDFGDHAEQEGLGFEYAAQARYRINERWAAAVLMFGEIDELIHAGPFEAQDHVLGPSLYLFSASFGDDEGPGYGRDWSLGAGVLFGLTEASPTATLRITFAVEY